MSGNVISNAFACFVLLDAPCTTFPPPVSNVRQFVVNLNLTVIHVAASVNPCNIHCDLGLPFNALVSLTNLYGIEHFSAAVIVVSGEQCISNAIGLLFKYKP